MRLLFLSMHILAALTGCTSDTDLSDTLPVPWPKGMERIAAEAANPILSTVDHPDGT